MPFEEDTDLSKTGYINIAKEKPVRPVNLIWLNAFGALNIVFSIICVVTAYMHNFVSAGCAAAAGLLVTWCGMAFLWQSIRQMNDKIQALTTIVEKNPKSSRDMG